MDVSTGTTTVRPKVRREPLPVEQAEGAILSLRGERLILCARLAA